MCVFTCMGIKLKLYSAVEKKVHVSWSLRGCHFKRGLRDVYPSPYDDESLFIVQSIWGTLRRLVRQLTRTAGCTLVTLSTLILMDTFTSWTDLRSSSSTTPTRCVFQSKCTSSNCCMGTHCSSTCWQYLKRSRLLSAFLWILVPSKDSGRGFPMLLVEAHAAPLYFGITRASVNFV